MNGKSIVEGQRGDIFFYKKRESSYLEGILAWEAFLWEALLHEALHWVRRPVRGAQLHMTHSAVGWAEEGVHPQVVAHRKVYFPQEDERYDKRSVGPAAVAQAAWHRKLAAKTLASYHYCLLGFAQEEPAFLALQDNKRVAARACRLRL